MLLIKTMSTMEIEEKTKWSLMQLIAAFVFSALIGIGGSIALWGDSNAENFGMNGVSIVIAAVVTVALSYFSYRFSGR